MQAVARRRYFMLGSTMPRKMTFWQAIKTIAVGIETSTNLAMTAHGCPLNSWLIWYIQTASVHLLFS